jgi:hypothetical protein
LSFTPLDDVRAKCSAAESRLNKVNTQVVEMQFMSREVFGRWFSIRDFRGCGCCPGLGALRRMDAITVRHAFLTARKTLINAVFGY